MKHFEYTIETAKTFDDAVAAIEATSAQKGFRVLHTHDVAATLQEKGFPREPLKIIEICNARYASEVLNKDIRVSVMLPCPISVYKEGEKTKITTLLPTIIAGFFPDAVIDAVASEVEKAVLEIVNAAAA
jgi:uncharacterized protein (DUF302 family)